MIRNTLYYSIKPLVPYALRLAIRRQFALRKRAQVSDVWPILPGSQKAPEGWRGWPEGKRFAFIITHDVEGQAGLDKCRALVDLELKLGFRSSFNFIPEDEYRVSQELRDELTRNGFEVGVHDLYHDGKLYSSRSEFTRRAERINGYLKEWGASGFRSGFMLHRLEWLHDLDVTYDASTFDTDPFEPEPDGMHTIFPFWVSNGQAAPSHRDVNGERNRNRGYVELPYTLPQDSTLFLLFRESTPDVWFRKLDWIAAHGGMALVNIHPDYIRFPGEARSLSTYSADMVVQLLEYVRTRYAGQYWHALPREVAKFHNAWRTAERPPQAKPESQSALL